MNCRSDGATFRDDEVLVGREAEVAPVHLGDLTQPGEPRRLGRIGHTARLDAQRQVPAAIEAFDPAEAVAGRGELETAAAARARSPGGG